MQEQEFNGLMKKLSISSDNDFPQKKQKKSWSPFSGTNKTEPKKKRKKRK